MSKPSKMGRGAGVIRRPSFKGRVVFSEWRGVPRVAIQKVRRKKKISPKQKQAMDDFSTVAEICKVIAPSQQLAAYELTKGTQYFPRDIIYMAVYGRLATLVLDDNRKVYSMAAKLEVSGVLDALGQLPGQMLFRDFQGWEAIEAGAEGFVLTMVDGKPLWMPPQAGGPGPGFSGSTLYGSAAAADTLVAVSKGLVIEPLKPVVIERFDFPYVPHVSQYRGGFQIVRHATLDPMSQIAEVLYTSPTMDLASGNRGLYQGLTDNEPALLPGNLYSITHFMAPPSAFSYARTLSVAATQGVVFQNGPFITREGQSVFSTGPISVGDIPQAFSDRRITASVTGFEYE